MNSDVIRLLPDSVANQIAAGEVIQRPASVVKELVENAVDAGATDIQIVIRDAGRTLIQVVDNGCGMSPTDARMAFERHATSKISSAEDLYSLHTMGFRGEALPSIAAVAQIELRTMRADDSIGTRLTVSESRFEAQEPCVCSKGTNMMVKNIFFHMPARRKFLKRDSIELGHILREFERLALVNCGISFSLTHNGVTLHQLGVGNLKQRISGLFGKTMESHLAPLSTQTSVVKATGYIELPRYAKRRAAQQFFFVNSRYMRHPVFHKVVMRCYEPMLPADTAPSYFINFEVAPESIDVNIHPQKYEIKFEYEPAICQILEAAIREALGKAQAVGALDFDSDQHPDIPLFAPDDKAPMPGDGSDDTSEFCLDSHVGGLRAATWNRPAVSAGVVPGNWEQLYRRFNNDVEDGVALRTSSLNPAATPDQSIGTLFDAPAPDKAYEYLRWQPGRVVTLRNDSLLIIDQQRAHLRILYERILKQMEAGPLASQKLIFPEDIELPPDQSALLIGIADEITTYGFDITNHGGLNWTIEAVPAVVAAASTAGEALQELLSALTDGTTPTATLRTPLALAMARRAAMSSDKPLSKEEMHSLVEDLFCCQSPACTPDGLPVYFAIDRSEVDRRL